MIFCIQDGEQIPDKKKQSWHPEDKRRAITAFETNEMGWLRASKKFNVPQATLRRRAKNRTNA